MEFTIHPKLELRDPMGRSLGCYSREELIGMCNRTLVELKETSGEVERLLHAVCDHYQIYFHQIIGKSREERIVWPRQVAMALLIERGMSQGSTAKALRCKTHGAAKHAADRVAEVSQTNPTKASQLTALREKLSTNETQTKI